MLSQHRLSSYLTALPLEASSATAESHFCLFNSTLWHQKSILIRVWRTAFPEGHIQPFFSYRCASFLCCSCCRWKNIECKFDSDAFLSRGIMLQEGDEVHAVSRQILVR